MSGDVVLRIPYDATSFHNALESLRQPFPTATYQERQVIFTRAQEWTGVTVALDDAAYIPLKTEWMPTKDRKTDDNVEVLIAGRWPQEIKDAIADGKIARISATIIDKFWKMVQNGSGKIVETERGINVPTADGDATPESPVATPETDAGNVEHVPEKCPDATPVAAQEEEARIATGGLSCESGPARISPRLKHVDGWTWSHIVSEIRVWSQYYPDPIPDPNDITEDEARRLLKEILQHPDVLDAEERQTVEAEAQLVGYRDGRTIAYAINVGVALPDPTPPPATQEFDCTDDGNGSRLVAQYRDSVRFCDHEKAWYLWNGIRWERDETRRMLALAKRVCRTIHIEASTASDDRREKIGKWAIASGMFPRLKAMIECASPAVAVTPADLDANPTLWNCLNGTLELDTGVFRPAKREDLLTKCCGVTYNPRATCPTWLAHLDLVFAGDREYIDGFQELCGYAMLQDNPEQIMAILYGTGKNGKSVTVGALARIWKDYAVNVAAESLMVKRSEGPRSDLARLKGARLVTASEGEGGAYLAESVVKQVTGDDTITVRRLYENEIEFRPGAKIFLATNHEPRIRGTDEGIWRRLWLMPFTVTIPEERRDRGILKRLEAEGSGILNWCLVGLRRYYENGCRLAPPEKVVAATKRFRSENDVVGRFLADEMVAEPTGVIERAALYKIYTKWCEEENEKPVSNRMMIKYLREKQFGERKMGGAWTWEGLRIKNRMEEEEDERRGSTQGML